MHVCVAFFLICYKNMITTKRYENNGDHNKIIIMITKDDVPNGNGLSRDYFVFARVTVRGIHTTVHRGHPNQSR